MKGSATLVRVASQQKFKFKYCCAIGNSSRVTAPKNQMRRLLHRAVQRSGLPSFARRTFATASTGAGLFASYNALLESNPIPTKAVTSAVIVGLGDIFCQLVLRSARSAVAAVAAARRLRRRRRAAPTFKKWIFE